VVEKDPYQQELADRQTVLRENQRISQLQREEELRLRQEKQRKFEEHRQRVAALQQAEYIAYDEERARAADELEWLDFETRMIGVVKQMIEPALLLSMEDREQNIELGCGLEK
jgi:hypothetical protein